MKRLLAALLALIVLLPSAQAESLSPAALTEEAVKWCAALPKDSQVLRAVEYSCDDIEGQSVHALLIAATATQEAYNFYGNAAGLLLVDLSDGKVYSHGDFPVFEGQPVQSREDALLWLFNCWDSAQRPGTQIIWSENEQQIPLTEEEIQAVNANLTAYFTPSAQEQQAESTMLPEAPAPGEAQAEATVIPEAPAEKPSVTAEPAASAAPEAPVEPEDRGEFGMAGTWLDVVYGSSGITAQITAENELIIGEHTLQIVWREENLRYGELMLDGEDVGDFYCRDDRTYASADYVLPDGTEEHMAFEPEWNFDVIEINMDNWQDYFELTEEYSVAYDAFDEIDYLTYRQQLILKQECVPFERLSTGLSKVAVEYVCTEGRYDCTLDDAGTLTFDELLSSSTGDSKVRKMGSQTSLNEYGLHLQQSNMHDFPQGNLYRVDELEILRIKGALYFEKTE